MALFKIEFVEVPTAFNRPRAMVVDATDAAEALRTWADHVTRGGTPATRFRGYPRMAVEAVPYNPGTLGKVVAE